MRGAREAPAPRDSLNFRRPSLLSRNELESGTLTVVLHATSSFTYVSVIYGANFSFNRRGDEVQMMPQIPPSSQTLRSSRCMKLLGCENQDFRQQMSFVCQIMRQSVWTETNTPVNAPTHTHTLSLMCNFTPFALSTTA